MIHEAIKMSSDEFGSHWNYRGVSLRYDRDEREWTFTMYQPRGLARPVRRNRREAMDFVDRLIDLDGYVADAGHVAHPER